MQRFHLPIPPLSRREQVLIAYLAFMSLCSLLQIALTTILLVRFISPQPQQVMIVQPTAARISATISPTRTPIPLKVYRVGQRFVSPNGYALTVTQVKESQGPDNFHPQSGNVFLLVELSLDNLVAESAGISLSDLVMKDSKGAIYSFHIDLATPTLRNSGIISKGKNFTGWLTYEIPKDASGLMLNYQRELVSFDLGR